MLIINNESNEYYIGIDHSVNKSAVCVVDKRGHIVKAAYFKKSKSSQKYTFTYYEPSQEKKSERTLRVFSKKAKKGSLDDSTLYFLETTLEDFLTGDKIVESEVILKGLKDGSIYDDGDYTRTILICESILDFIRTFQDKKIEIIIEGYSYSSPGNIPQIAESVGYLKILLIKEKLKFQMAPPNSVKLEIAGFGGGGKEVMEYALKNKYGVEFENDDLNDAFAMAEYCRLSCLELLKLSKAS
jgi:Holliday junction resolvasome RuvABC endonuclease subunit